MDSGQIIEDEGLFEMANVRPEITGLPFIVWISEKGNARHDVRVKVSSGPRARDFAASVSVRPDVQVMAGDLAAADLALVRAWIDLNRDVIVDFWNGDILYTDEVLAALRKLPDA
ncbi:MAG: hypothetical protein JNJ73_07435 [Hyphomonadaceae bacterium]|nr:hypothetical protein [Hyphomonadaceae bacterium]